MQPEHSGFFLGAPMLVGMVLFSFVGGHYLRKGMRSMHLRRASSDWRSVTGSIQSSSLEVDESNEHTSYDPKISFCYIVGGHEYTGTTLRFGHLSFNQRSAAQQVVDRYPTGSQVKVFYKPDSPTDSVLERVTAGVFTDVLLGIAFCMLGLGGLLEGWFRYMRTGYPWPH